MADNVMKKKEEILLDIEEKLKEEKWTRAAIESYTVKNFVELDNVIRFAIEQNFKEELKVLCKENLKHFPNSIVGLYIVGVLSLEESAVDDTHIPQILKLFMDNKKYKVSEFLAEKVLSYRESKFALKTLEDVYSDQGNQDELFNIRKRLVLVDSKDAGNAKILGEHYEKENDRDQAMFYYRLALERFIKAKSVKMIEDLWTRVLRMYPEDPALVIAMCRKIREVLGDERVADMAYNDFVRVALKNEKNKDALKVLKVIIDFKQGDKVLRKAVEDCYRLIYKDHSQLEKYLKLSAIGQSWKPHKEAIRVFESHIAFDQGSYVSHKNWGIGVVKELQNDKVVIDFESRKNHEMALEIALRALTVLDSDHIIIWKNFKKNELKEILKNEPLKVVEIILRSSGNEASSADIKAVLVPDALSESEWNKWWILTKKQLEGSHFIVPSLTKRNMLELRDKELSLADEIVSKFKKTTNFENKLKLLVDFQTHGGDINSDTSQALAVYFKEIVGASSELAEKKLLSFCALRYANWTEWNDAMLDSSVIFAIKDLTAFYDQLDLELKKTMLLIFIRKIKDWDVKFGDFLLYTPLTKLNNFMLKELETYEKVDIINTVFATSMNTFQENPELFVWLSRVVFDENEKALKEKIGLKDGEFILRLLTLLEMLNNEIDQKESVGLNKKLVAAIYDILLKKGILESYLAQADESAARMVLSLIMSSMSLKDELKTAGVEQIQKKYPALKKVDKQEKVKIRPAFFVTRKSYDGKKAELNHIMSVDIPENSRAIGEAMEKGDLRENSEYKAALEKQDQLKAAASKLEMELNQAKVIDRNMVDTGLIDVGTRVTLKNQDGKKEVYQILGQWDVDFKNQIISYHSPLGKALLDKKVGDTVNFEFNNEKKVYEVQKIELADFE